MHETSGVLKPVVLGYIHGDALDPAEIVVFRAYLRQWINADWQDNEDEDESIRIRRLRSTVDALTTREAISRWIHDAVCLGLDPL